MGLAGAAVVGVAFGMVRYVYGLTLPDIRAELDVPELMVGLIASGTFIGFLLALILSKPLAIWRGARAPTTVGGVCGTLGCALVAVAPSPEVLAVGALVAGSAAGWVWAPYSDIVAAVAVERDRPRLLAWITTGASGGLILVGALALAAVTWASWRWTWAGIAAASAAAAALNLLWVPRVPASQPSQSRGVAFPIEIVRPLVFSAVFFVACTAYFTYATDAAHRGGLGAIAGPAIFLSTGAVGLVGSVTGRMSASVGSGAVAAGALVAVGVALVLLSVGADSLSVVLASAVVFGGGNMIGSAVLAIWTAQLVPEQPASAFTVALVIGSLSSIGTPALIGALAPRAGLTTLLLAAATLAIATGLALAFLGTSRNSKPADS